MARRAQTIGVKDSGFLISWMGIGVGSKVLEEVMVQGFGDESSISTRGFRDSNLLSRDARQVGKSNMDRLREVLPEFPEWILLNGDMSRINDGGFDIRGS